MSEHAEIIQLIIAYTLTGAIVFTVFITCLSLVGWIRFADATQQRKLFYVLIVEIVVLGVGHFGNFLETNPQAVQETISTNAVDTYRIERLLENVDDLSSEQAIALIQSPPSPVPSGVMQVIEGRDPASRRTSDGEVAKELLKTILVLTPRDDWHLKGWEAALEEERRRSN